MKKLVVFLTLGVFLLLSVGIAQAGFLIPANDQAKDHAKAPEKSPVITETGAGEWDLGRIDFIHYARPDHAAKPVKPPKTESCYKLMGVKWNSLPIDYVINPTDSGLDEDFVVNTITAGAEAWDAETASELFNLPVKDNNAQYDDQNYENAIVFGDYSNPDVIGVTTVWYTRRGKQIVEFDMLLNTDFVWGDASSTTGVMDLLNIATHELGHAVGMADIYSDSCDYVTMYGYSYAGDMQKRTLEPPDIQGLEQMYGI